MYTLTVEGQDALRVIRYQGTESISSLFEFELFVTTEDPHLSFADLVGKPAALVLGDTAKRQRVVNGMVRRIELAHMTKLQTSYRVELVPHAHRLTLTNDCRIFQEKTVADIIDEVLGEWTIETVDIRLSGSYATREYCVQYRESDWTFINRLMEEEGIFYFFEHAEGETKLIVGDDKSVHSAIAGKATLTYRPHTGALGTQEETITRLWFGEEVRTGKVTVRDYNFKLPAVTVEGDSTADVDDDLEVYDYPANILEPADGKKRATLWLEAHQVPRKSGDGDSTCMRFMPGQTFSLGDTADVDIRDDLNIEYLITRLELRGAEAVGKVEGQEPEPYHNRFWVIPLEVPYRASHETPKPLIHGAQTAVVVGPGGEEIHTDEHGRIKVQFHWDRLGNKDEKSSCWVRVRQPWAGPGWGHVFIPRIGQEVVVDFLEGDPDRPLVSGAVYHASNVPPYSLPEEKTKSTLKTESSIGGGGYNELRFEDKQGSEEIYLQAEKDWNTLVKNDMTQTVGHDRTRHVERNEKVHVGKDRSKAVDGNQTEEISKDKSITVGGDHSEGISGNETISVGGNETLTVDKARSVSVSGKHDEAVKGDQTSTVKGSHTQTVTKDVQIKIEGNQTEAVKKSVQVTIDKDRQVIVKGEAKEDVGKEKTIIVGDKLLIECGDASVVIESSGKIGIKGKDISVKADGDIKVEGKKLEVKSKGGVKVKASGDVKVKGSKIGLN